MCSLLYCFLETNSKQFTSISFRNTSGLLPESVSDIAFYNEFYFIYTLIRTNPLQIKRFLYNRQILTGMNNRPALFAITEKF